MSTTSETAPDPAKPTLLVTRSEQLRHDVERLAAAAGGTVAVCADTLTLRHAWLGARAILVGEDLVAEVARGGLPRRPGIHVLARSPLDLSGLSAAVDLGVERIVDLPRELAQLAGLLADLADDVRPRGRVVGVVGGSGGVGASVLTVALTVVAGRSGCTALGIDLDPVGAGLEVVAGSGSGTALGWEALVEAPGRLNGRALRDAVATTGGPAILGWGTTQDRIAPDARVVDQALCAARRGHDWTFVDSRSPAVWPSCDAVVLVVAGSVHGAAAAARAARQLPDGVSAGLAVRTRRRDRWGPDLSRALGLPLWAAVTHHRSLDEHLSAGLGPARGLRSPLRRSATELLRQMGLS